MGQQVEELRGAREGRTVAYTQFLNDYKKIKSRLFMDL